ncbi:MAG: flippase [candidate division Zixibacteria bacterium]|nr:flippase [candidate division Zixibacteria bacterium]
MSIQKKIAKNAIYNFLVKAIGLAFAFVASVVVARFLGPDKYGVYSFVIWFLTMVGLLVNLGIPTTITKYVSEYWGRKDFSAISSILSRLLRVELLAGVVVSLALFLMAPLVARWYNNPDLSLYLKVASLVILPLGLMWLYNGFFCGLQRFDLIAKINLVVSPMTLITILMVLYLGGKIEWLVGVSVVANILLVGCYLYLKRTKFTFMQKDTPTYDFGGPNLDPRDKLLKFSASVFVILILDAIVWERFGIFFLSIFSTPTEIAFYNVAFILSSRPMILLPGALTGILLPAMSEVYGGGDKGELARVHANSTRYLAMLSLPLCLGGIAISRQLFPVLYGSSFQTVSFIFCILILGGTVGSIATSSSSLLYGAELQRIVVRVGIFSALITLLACWLLVPILGAKGAALANAFAQIAGGVAMITYAYKIYMKQKFPGLSIIRIFFASALMGSVAFLLAESIKGAAGMAFALIISFPLYILGLFFTRSLTSEDTELVEAAIGRLPESWVRVILPIFRWLIKFFYSSR